MNLANIIKQIVSTLEASCSDIVARIEVACDSYNVLEKINCADGQDIIIVNVGNEQNNSDCPQACVVEETFEIYVARGYGLAEADDAEIYSASENRSALYQLRDRIRDAVRALKFENEQNFLYEPQLRYVGAENFETPYNLRAAVFKLNFNLTGTIPEIK